MTSSTWTSGKASMAIRMGARPAVCAAGFRAGDDLFMRPSIAAPGYGNNDNMHTIPAIGPRARSRNALTALPAWAIVSTAMRPVHVPSPPGGRTETLAPPHLHPGREAAIMLRYAFSAVFLALL